MAQNRTFKEQLSDEKLISADLRIADAYIRNVFMQAPVAIVVYKGPSFIVDIINDHALNIWETTRNKVINKPLFEVAPQLQPEIESILTNVYTSGKPFTAIEFQIHSTENNVPTVRYLNLTFHPFHDLNGTITGVTSISGDVTAEVSIRKKIEESEKQIRQLKDQLDLSINVGKIGVWNLDIVNNLLHWSKEQCELYGLSEEEGEQTSESFLNFVNPVDQQRLKKELADNISLKKKDAKTQFRIIGKDGVKRWIESRSKTFYDDLDKPVSVTGIDFEMSVGKLFAYEHEQKDYEHTAQIENQNTRLQKINQELESLNSILSLDLQDSLKRIQMLTDVINQKEGGHLPENVKEYLQLVQHEVSLIQTRMPNLRIFLQLTDSEKNQ